MKPPIEILLDKISWQRIPGERPFQKDIPVATHERNSLMKPRSLGSEAVLSGRFCS